jgi:small subunit ribosomal protein S5
MAEQTTNTQPKDVQPKKFGARNTRGGFSNRGDKGGPRKGGRPTFERAKPEFEQRIIGIRRVTRVVAGGRRMSFAVSMVIGDKKGTVGLGTGKAGDTALAITKALRSARKNLLKLHLTKEFSIPHDIEAKYGSARVFIMPNRGKGLVAGSAARDILNLAGVKNVTAKYHSGSKNKLNNARAAMLALSRVATKTIKVVKDEE